MKFKKLLLVALSPEWQFLKKKHDFSQLDRNLFKLSAFDEVGLLQVGMGKEYAERNFRIFLEKHTTESALLFGSCGGLDPSLQAGELVSNQKLIGCDAPYKTGGFLCVDKPLKNQSEKQSAFERSQALAVDMESEPLRNLCDENQISFYMIKGVFDESHEDLEDFGEPFDDKGNLLTKEMTINLIKNPKLILKIPSLKKRLKKIENQLEAVIDWYLSLGD